MPTKPDLYDTRRHKWVVQRCRCERCKRTGERYWVALQPEGTRHFTRAFGSWGGAMAYALAAAAAPPAPSPWPDRPMRRGWLGLWL